MSLELVQKVKERLVKAGEDLSGPCGGFKITRRVAWNLKQAGDTSVGLLSKPGGNNCEGYSVDALCYPDGSIRDILGDAGGNNTPNWPDPTPAGDVDPARWRAPIDPGDVGVPVPPTPPASPPVVVDLGQMLLILGQIEGRLMNLQAQLDTLHDEVANSGSLTLAAQQATYAEIERLGTNEHAKEVAVSYQGKGPFGSTIVLRPV